MERTPMQTTDFRTLHIELRCAECGDIRTYHIAGRFLAYDPLGAVNGMNCTNCRAPNILTYRVDPDDRNLIRYWHTLEDGTIAYGSHRIV